MATINMDFVGVLEWNTSCLGRIPGEGSSDGHGLATNRHHDSFDATYDLIQREVVPTLHRQFPWGSLHMPVSELTPVMQRVWGV